MRAMLRNGLRSAAVPVLLASCQHSAGQSNLMLQAPPVVPAALVTAQQVPRNDHPTLQRAASGDVSVSVALSYAQYGKSPKRRLLAKTDLAAAADPSPSREPLNLALVVDRSGSMGEDRKFAFAMETARMLVENLSDQDIVSLIAFDDRAVVLSPAGRAVNKEFLYYRLGQLAPQGYSNLSAGLLEGIAQIDSQSAPEQRRQVVVVTDGLGNRGISEPERLEKLIAAAHERGIVFSILGVGTPPDEPLFTDLAAAGSGRYTTIRSPEEIPEAVAAELQGLRQVVGQNATLEVRTLPGTKLTRVFGRILEKPVTEHTIELGDIHAGDHGVFLVEIAPTVFEPGAVAGVDVILTMDSPETGRREHLTLRSEAAFSDKSQAIRESVNESVVLYGRVLDALEKAEEAILGLDADRFRETQRAFDTLYEEARSRALAARDQQLLNRTFLFKHFMAELDAINNSGLLHDHDEAKRRLGKEADYRRYLLEHHRPPD